MKVVVVYCLMLVAIYVYSEVHRADIISKYERINQ